MAESRICTHTRPWPSVWVSECGASGTYTICSLQQTGSDIRSSSTRVLAALLTQPRFNGS
eukprot:1157781-Amphidinium_carterae.1